MKPHLDWKKQVESLNKLNTLGKTITTTWGSLTWTWDFSLRWIICTHLTSALGKKWQHNIFCKIRRKITYFSRDRRITKWKKKVSFSWVPSWLTWTFWFLPGGLITVMATATCHKWIKKWGTLLHQKIKTTCKDVLQELRNAVGLQQGDKLLYPNTPQPRQ